MSVRKPDVEAVLKQHTGRDDTISSDAIAEQLGIEDSTARPKTRETVREILIDETLPVASTSKGYFVAETEEEATRYLQTLDSRLSEIEKRRQSFIEAARRNGIYDE